MRIRRIDLFQVSYQLKDGSYTWSRGHGVTGFTGNIVRLMADDGLTGFGEVCPLGSSYIESFSRGVVTGIQELGPVLLGADPTSIREINTRMDLALGGHAYVKSPIDIACHDLLGRATGQPVCTLIGGRRRDDYPLYRAIPQRAPEAMAEDVLRYRAEGYTRFQLKVGGDPDEDIRRIRAVREVLGGADVLVADANTGWLQHQAVRIVNAVRDLDVYIEAPCLSYEECLAVRQHTDLPMVLDEHITGVGILMRASADHAMDAVNIKISRVGGLTKAVQMRDLCESLGIAMTLEDSWGGDIATATIAHLVGSTHPDFLFTSTDFNSYNDTSVAADAPRRDGGRLKVPAGPGLGITIDERALGAPVVSIT
jgi:L-alanine-DL-glutamate epimerase-like enolase superfamily enzyme